MRTAVVTGASRGIGRAIAEQLAADGMHVVIIDIDPHVEDVARAIGGTARVADITAPPQVAKVAATVENSSERLSVLVNNAGITRDALLRKMTEQDFRAVLRVNLGAAMGLTEALAPLIEDGGSIVNVSSRAQLGNVGQFNYIISKAGIIVCTRAFALNYAPRLRVNAVAPGFTLSEMTAAMPEAVRGRIVDQIPLKRPAQPSEMADVVSWLASDSASFVTGQVVYACGGRSFAATGG